MAFSKMKETIDSYTLPDPLKKFYKIESEYMIESYSIPNMDGLGVWVEKDGGNYFAYPTYKQVPYVDKELVEDEGPFRINIFRT